MKITSVDIFLLRHVGEEFSPFPFRPAVCRVQYGRGDLRVMVKPAFP